MKQNFAIIGCGRIAQKHACEIIRVGKIIAVCDNDPVKAQHFSKQFNVNFYTSVDEMFQKEPSIELVSICSPNYLHKEHTIKAIQAGKEVLCEKPMSIKSRDARDMINAANENNSKLFVVKSSRYHYCIQNLKRLLDENRLGHVFSFNLNFVWNRPNSYFENSWKGTTEKDGGILFTQFSHYIDALIWLLGDVESFSGYRSNRSQKHIDFEDTGVLAIKMKSGAIGTLHYSINSFEKNQEVSLNIVAEKASLIIGGEYMNEIKYQKPDELFQEIENEFSSPALSGSNHDKIYDDFIKAVNNLPSSIPDGLSALKSIELIEEIYNSIKL